MRRSLLRRSCAALIALAAVLFAAAPALARKPAPHLVIASEELKGNPYAFWKEKQLVLVDDTTKNVGSARAGPSVTRVYLVREGNKLLLAQRAVPALPPGRHDTGTDTSPLMLPIAFPIGSYALEICADAKHQVNRRGTHSCKAMLPRNFFVIPRAWTGSLGGKEIERLTDEWSSPNARLTFDQYEGAGVVSYLFSGAVTWSDNGEDAGGCKITGSGTRTYANDASIGALSVDYLRETYSGNLQDTTGPPYQVTFSGCESPPPPQPGAYEPAFWLPLGTGTSVGLPWGSTSLPGSPRQVNGGTWTWNLQATHG
jgi:hypothetical protein